jgi:hypothetical protein
LINGFDRVRYGADRSETTPAAFAQNNYELRDIFSKVLGKHALKFGVEHRWEQDNNNLLGGARPLYTFQGLWNFANDASIFELINADPTTGGPASAQRYFRSRNLALFVQDDWKIRPNLTLNLGLRWEYFAPLSEAHGQASNLILDPDLVNSRFVVTDQLSNPDRNNFAPRFGFAWQPQGFHNRLSVRGGIGVAFNRIPDVLFANSRGNPPFFARFGLCCYAGSGILYALGSSDSPTSYPANPALALGVDPVTNIPNGSSVEAWAALPNTPTPYTYLYSLDTETQLPWKWIATIGYQGSVSHKLIRILNRNFVETPNPRIFQAFFPTPDVNASFNALNVEVRRPFANNFSMAVKYRWSKSMDELSNEGPGGQTNQMWPQNLILDSGPSDYDATHSLTVYGLWQSPWFKGRTDTVGMLLGGWKFSGIYNFHTGFPWSPKYFTCEILFGSCLSPIRPQAYLGGAGSDASNDAFMTGSNFPGGGGAFFTTDPGGGAPGIGRNSFRGPRYTDVDLTFGKDTSLPWFGDQRSKLNLSPLGFFSGGTIVTDPHLGQSDSALAGRVIQLQTKFRF